MAQGGASYCIYICIYAYYRTWCLFCGLHSCKTITGTTVPKVQTIYYFWVCSRTSIGTPLKCREVNSDWLKLLEYIVLNCFSTLVGATKSEKSRCHHKNRCPPSGWWLPLGAGLIARRRIDRRNTTKGWKKRVSFVMQRTWKSTRWCPAVAKLAFNGLNRV